MQEEFTSTLSTNKQNINDFLRRVIEYMPADWLHLTTHRLDTYNEAKAKVEFLEAIQTLFDSSNFSEAQLAELPTAYDYIRLGHPLSSLLEWAIAKQNGLKPTQVIAFDSQSMPILAVLRKNKLSNLPSRLYYMNDLPEAFDVDQLKRVYGYQIELKKINRLEDLEAFDGSSILLSEKTDFEDFAHAELIDFSIRIHPQLGSVILAYNEAYVGEIQHVRRRESIAMTPSNSLAAIKLLLSPKDKPTPLEVSQERAKVEDLIKEVSGTNSKPLIGSSGLSVQYAIMMGLIGDALKRHAGKSIKFIVPPNCYGGTNDQARRVAEAVDQVAILDLPVDGDNDMVQSIDQVLEKVASIDGIPYIIAEIPTNPRVEVPDLLELKKVLTKKRYTPSGKEAIDPVFILDQTFCPNIQFLGEGKMLADVRTISYASGSKFPSGGKCTAGYLVVNDKAQDLLARIEAHLHLCDNQATPHQMELLAEQMPSMIQRIEAAYQNTREFVEFIKSTLPQAKINFVSEELANEGFMPSVFSLDLPSKGKTAAEKEKFKRELNLKLIHKMISEIPNESKYCVSYGQLKGCYWTVPATSTQGTTKEADKDYIARVSVSPDLDLAKHKAVFADFVRETALAAL